jgi:acetyltransferase
MLRFAAGSFLMRPYPDYLVQRVTLSDGSEVKIRPIRPDDSAIEQQFVRDLSAESRYFRFMGIVRELSPQMLAHFTRVDYDRHMALIAVTEQEGREIQVAVARYIADEDRKRCEFAVVVADSWQRKRLGTRMMEALMEAARAAGVRVMFGEVLASNHKMLRLTAGLGYVARSDERDPRVIRIEKNL